ncbi:potassium transporter TrkA [Halorientalis pallida]|uniref:potassium transporter TrkA n=1 Tax=Halorientalis pallida TaxID=2479928 RepID=UPI003C6FA6EF
MAAPSLPVEVLLGISFGVLIGIVVSFAVGVFSFTISYYWDQELSQIAVVLLILPLVAVDALYVGIIGSSVQQVPRLLIGLLVIIMIALYANSQGQKIAAELPRETTQPTERKRTLSAEAVDAVDGLGQVTIRTAGEIREIDGYPSLSPDVRTALEEGAWRLPADLPLPELERRLEDQLRTDHDLGEVSVSIDGRGRATITAAPPTTGVASRVPDGWRAVSVSALLPAGLTAEDKVTVRTGEGSVAGTVLGIDRATGDSDGMVPDGGSATASGAGRVTVAVPASAAGTLLDAERGRIVVEPRGRRHDFEAFSLLDGADRTIRRLTLTPAVREALADDEIQPLAVRDGVTEDDDGADETVDTDETPDADPAERGARHGWAFGPEQAALERADEAFVVGESAVLRRLDDRTEGER